MSTSWIWMLSKSPSPVILKFPAPWALKLEQSKLHSMCHAGGARNPRLLPLSLPVLVHRMSGARVDRAWPVVVGAAAVVLVTVVVGARVATAGSGSISRSPRSPAAATPADSTMTPARMTDQRRYQGGLGSSMGNLRREC